MSMSIGFSTSSSTLLDVLGTINDAMQTSMTRLTTGRSVNSAADNPGVYFQASMISSRAAAIDNLSSSILLASNTLGAAATGLSAIGKQLESLTSTLTAAKTAGSGSSGAVALSKQSFSSAGSALVAASATSPGQFHNGDVFSINVNGKSLYFSATTGTADLTASGADADHAVSVKTVGDLAKAVSAFNWGTDAGGSAVTVTAAVDGGSLAITASADMTIKVEQNGSSTAVNDIGAMFDGASGVSASNGAFAVSTQGASGVRKRAEAFQAIKSTMAQIDKIAADASVPGGVNLLTADASGRANMLTVQVSDSGATQAVRLDGLSDASGIGLTADFNSRLASDDDLQAALTSVQAALTTVQSRQSAIGSSQSLLTSRKDFNTAMSKILSGAVDSMTGIDSTAETNRISALQSRQQIAVKAMAIANQRDQMLLNLL